MYINQQIHVFTIIYRNAHLDFVNECTKNRKIEEEKTTVFLKFNIKNFA